MLPDEIVEDLKQQIVDSCVILARTGNVREITGHVSVRIPDSDDILVRCRRRDDPGVEFTTIDDVKRVDLEGHGDELVDGYQVPGEFAIHAEIYKARPDVSSVVHAHPRNALLCGILGLPLLPIFGAYDPAAMRLAIGGIPIFPTSVLISTESLGKQLVSVMGDAPVCLLQGHGTVAVGVDVPQATVRAINFETLAEVTVQAAATGRTPKVLTDEDIAEIMNFASIRDSSPTLTSWTWGFYRRACNLV